MTQQVLELLHRKIEEERKALVENLGDGVAKDYAEYQRLCGVVTGLLTAQREIQDLAKNLKETEDD